MINPKGVDEPSLIWEARNPDIFLFAVCSALVTQPMMQRPPNPTELRLMDSYIQILCRFQKSKQKVPPLSLPCTKKSP